ncbi:hypothetical protein FWH13_01450 [Candidatus Saccharibacteria bacterium]|nr:hypothetical protein [Candidatus Saccharibacteria bacterium]
MSDKIIRKERDANGRVIVRLYGKDLDVTEMADETGRGTFKAGGKVHTFEIIESVDTEARPKRQKKNAPEPEAETSSEEPTSESEVE